MDTNRKAGPRMGGFYEHLIGITERVKHSKNVLRVGNITLMKENLPRGK